MTSRPRMNNYTLYLRTKGGVDFATDFAQPSDEMACVYTTRLVENIGLANLTFTLWRAITTDSDLGGPLIEFIAKFSLVSENRILVEANE